MKHRNKFLPTIFLKYHVNAPRSAFQLENLFDVFNLVSYDEFWCNLSKLTKRFEERPALTSQFNVSKLQKQL